MLVTVSCHFRWVNPLAATATYFYYNASCCSEHRNHFGQCRWGWLLPSDLWVCLTVHDCSYCCWNYWRILMSCTVLVGLNSTYLPVGFGPTLDLSWNCLGCPLSSTNWRTVVAAKILVVLWNCRYGRDLSIVSERFQRCYFLLSQN